jgi:hypothetical protein
MLHDDRWHKVILIQPSSVSAEAVPLASVPGKLNSQHSQQCVWVLLA